MKTASFLAITAIVLLTLPSRAAAPDDFTVKSATDKSSFSLKQVRGKFVAVHFLLKTECPYCLRHTNDYFTKAASLPDVIQVFLKPDTDVEIEKWAAKLPAGQLTAHPIYRDPNARLAKAFDIPDGYKFHGQTVHYPATVLIGPGGKEAFRYVGKSNADRLAFEKLADKVKELTRSGASSQTGGQQPARVVVEGVNTPPSDETRNSPESAPRAAPR
ncbi:MAG: redoxin domain-containing protein [Verrucomicrobiaceae bacterium]|nr:redoxin domain-containing protein [Verrucomicrobiaceae bacterium]